MNKTVITRDKPIYQCYRISDDKQILTHFNGKSEFESLDELFHLININFDIDRYDFLIKGTTNDKTILIDLKRE